MVERVFLIPVEGLRVNLPKEIGQQVSLALEKCDFLGTAQSKAGRNVDVGFLH